MGKFKVGDRVTHNPASNVDVERHWNEHFRRTQGDIVDGALVVVSVHERNVGLSNKAGPAFFYMPPSKLKLADSVPAALRSGDRVRVVKESPSYTSGGSNHNRKIGEQFTLKAMNRANTFWRTDEGVDFYPNEIELIPSLTIEAGKFYKTRDGRKVGPSKVSEWPNGDWKWSLGQLWLFKDDGTSGGTDRQNDLIAEWVDETAAQTAVASNDNAEPTLGDILQAAIGKRVTVKVKKPKFKVGDRLFLARSFHGSALVGATGTVGPKGMFDSFVDVIWNHDDLSNGQMNGGYFPDYFDHAPANPAIVCLIENGQPKPAIYPHVHADEGAASKEASRLASVHKGQKFGVYVLTQTVSEERVYSHEWQNLAIKGEKISAIKALKAANDLTLKGAKDAVEHWLELNAA